MRGCGYRSGRTPAFVAKSDPDDAAAAAIQSAATDDTPGQLFQLGVENSNLIKVSGIVNSGSQVRPVEAPSGQISFLVGDANGVLKVLDGEQPDDETPENDGGSPSDHHPTGVTDPPSARGVNELVVGHARRIAELAAVKVDARDAQSDRGEGLVGGANQRPLGEFADPRVTQLREDARCFKCANRLGPHIEEGASRANGHGGVLHRRVDAVDDGGTHAISIQSWRQRHGVATWLSRQEGACFKGHCTPKEPQLVFGLTPRFWVGRPLELHDIPRPAPHLSAART